MFHTGCLQPDPPANLKAMPVDETSINRTEVNVFCHQFRNCFLEFINETANEFILCMNVNDSEANKLKIIHHFDIDCQNIRFCNDICLAKCKFLDSYMMVDMQLKKVRNICINKEFRPFFRVYQLLEFSRHDEQIKRFQSSIHEN